MGIADRVAPPLLLAALITAGLAGLETRRAPPAIEPPPDYGCVMPMADPDLDGDGRADRFDGIFESCGTEGCGYDVYLRRDGGDEYVGRIDGYWPFEIERRSDDEPADVIGKKRYRFVDGAYR